MEHTGTNAILQFSSTITTAATTNLHGEELICSFELCRKNGPKFRYCHHCQKAVAKRNFRKRHAHPEIYEKRRRKIAVQQQQQQSSSQCHTVIQSSKISNPNNKIQSNFPLQTTYYPNCIDSSQCTMIEPSYNDISTTVSSNDHIPSIDIDDDNEGVPQAWIRLYHARPKNGDKRSIKNWLMYALRVAEVSSKQHQFNSQKGSQIVEKQSLEKSNCPVLVPNKCGKDLGLRINTSQPMEEDSYASQNNAQSPTLVTPTA